MAREAILRDAKVNTSRRFTCANATAITKGTFLKCADPFTASASTGTGDFFVGFAHADKEANDGATSITADKGGVYDLTASGAITTGQFVKTAVPGNYVMACTNTDMTSSYAVAMGLALEDASDGEVINVEIFG